MKISETKSGYRPVYSDNIEMYNLGGFLRETVSLRWIDEALSWARDPESNDLAESDEVTIWEEEDGSLGIYYHGYCEDTIVDLDASGPPFKITFDKFIRMLEEWKEVISKKPHFIIVKKEGDDISFEEEYRDEIKIDLSKAKFSTDFFKNMIEPRFKEGRFYGSFHLQDFNENIKMENKQTGDGAVLSFDIEFEKDYTFNHAFFPENWNQDKLKKEISRKLKDNYTLIKGFANDNNFFTIITVVTSNIVPMRIILSKDFEIVSCYPVFEEI